MTQWGLDNLFNPGKRHMDDEKRRLQSTREEVGDNSGGRRIDLEAGKVSIAVRRPTDTAVDEPEDDAETALDPALEAEEMPALALANDEAEIVPEVVDDTGVDAETQGAAGSDPAEPAASEVAAPEAEAHEEDDVPISAPPEAPAATAPRRRQLSANAWSRRG